jgi:hypothetical protein
MVHGGGVGQNPGEPASRRGGEVNQSTSVWYRTQFSSRVKGELTRRGISMVAELGRWRMMVRVQGRGHWRCWPGW